MTLEQAIALRARLHDAMQRVERWRKRGRGPAISLSTLLQMHFIVEHDDLLDAMERKYERDKRILRSA